MLVRQLPLWCLFWLASTGCTAALTADRAGQEPELAAPLELLDQAETLTMRARSSSVALLEGGYHYRIEYQGSSAITLALLDEFDDAHARVRIRAIDLPDASSAWVLDFDDLDVGVGGRIELWTRADRVHGNATIGERSASWRARLDEQGRLAAERWQVGPNRDPRVLAAIRRARAIGRDLASLTDTLEGEKSCELGAAMTHVELALDLALRAYEGRGRSEMPVWTAEDLADRCG